MTSSDVHPLVADAAELGLAPRRRLGPLVGAGVVLALALTWLVVFSLALVAMPATVDGATLPEIPVTARHLPGGKSRLGLELPDGRLDRHACDPLSRICRHVTANSPETLQVRLWQPSSGPMSDTVVLAARAGDVVLVDAAEGQANFAALKSTYRGGLLAAVVGVCLASLQLAWRWRLPRG